MSTASRVALLDHITVIAISTCRDLYFWILPDEEPTTLDAVMGGRLMPVWQEKERSMANDKNPNQKEPGEKESGKYHYNPGNQSGKTVEIIKPESEQENNVDRIKSRRK